MLNTLQKHILITLSFFTLLVFSCKSQIPQDSSYLSMNTSGSISNNFNFPNPLNGNGEVDLENYDVKSALGPVMTTECALDKTNFAGDIEKFNLSANPNADYMYRKVEGGELLDFSTEEKSDIWYIFTNTTGTDIRIPYFEVATEQEEEPNPGDNPGGQGGQGGSSDNPGGGGSSDNPGGQGGQGGSSDNPGGQGGSSDNPGGQGGQGGSSDNPGGGGSSDNPGGQGGQGGSSDNPGSNTGDIDDGSSKTPVIVDLAIDLPEVKVSDSAKYKDISKYVDLSKSDFSALLNKGTDSVPKVNIYFREPIPNIALYFNTTHFRYDKLKKIKSALQDKYISNFEISKKSLATTTARDLIIAGSVLFGQSLAPILLPVGFGTGLIYGEYRATFEMSYLQWLNAYRDYCRNGEKCEFLDAFYSNAMDESRRLYYYNTASLRDSRLKFWNDNKGKSYPDSEIEHCFGEYEVQILGWVVDFPIISPGFFDSIAWDNTTNSIDVDLHPLNWPNLNTNYEFKNLTNEIYDWLWAPEGNSGYVYSYSCVPILDYYLESAYSGYITNGDLGFGIYINRPDLKRWYNGYTPDSTNWFIPIKETDGAQGRGYYLNGKLVGKKATVAFSIPESEDYSNTNNTIDVNNALNASSLNQDEIINNTLKRIKKSELPQPLRLVPKEESQGISEETKGLNDSKSNLGDKVGSKQVFVELLTQNGFNYYRNATCKLVRTVSTAYGDRTLVIYEDDALRDKPDNQYYQSVADLFLLPGLNNDIYDKITNVFGSEWGYYNSTFLKSLSSAGDYPLIKKTNTITLFYTDIGNIGNSSEYLSAAYLPTDIYTNESYPGSNERLMIHVHAPKATNGYFSESILGITREFERLIHDQYFSEDLKNYCYNEQIKKFGSERPVDKSGFTDYFFSFLAKVIAANTLRDNKYDVPASFNLFSLTDKTFTNLFGLDKYYLYGMDRFNLEALTLKAQEGDDYQSIAKAVISSFAYYIYTNFGSGFIRKYALGNKVGLEGIVEAINSIYGTQYTLSELLASWAVATVSSSVLSTSRPYTFNYANRFKVQGVDYPNINFANTTAYRSSKKGIPSAGSYYVVNNSSSCYKVASSRIGNYKAYAPELPEGLDLRILAVPKYLYPQVTP